MVDVPARRSADVAGYPLRRPPEVVRRREVGEHVEPLLVAQVRARLDEPRGVDDQSRLAIRLPRFDQPGNRLEAHVGGRLSLPPGGAGLRERLTPLTARGSPGPCTVALSPPASHRQRRPTNASKLNWRRPAPRRPAGSRPGRARAGG